MSNNEELYSYLFATRLELEDTYYNESDIIKKLRNTIIDYGIEEEHVNKTLYDFYHHFNIDITMEIIQEATINNVENNINSSPSSYINVNQNNLLNLLNNILSSQGNAIQVNLPNNIDISGNNIILPINNNNEENEDNEENEENEGNFQPSNLIQQFISIPMNGQFNHANILNMLNNFMDNFDQVPYQPDNFENVVVTVGDSINKLKTTTLETTLDHNCTICMGCMDKDEIVSELPCKHIFHDECIKPYLNSYNCKCPVCRADIRETK